MSMNTPDAETISMADHLRLIQLARNDALREAAARCGDGEVSRMYRDAILALIEGNAHG
ncbi:MAG: hypothetical protein ACU0EX_03885 [Sulfitobacter sp.]